MKELVVLKELYLLLEMMKMDVECLVVVVVVVVDVVWNIFAFDAQYNQLLYCVCCQHNVVCCVWHMSLGFMQAFSLRINCCCICRGVLS